MAMTQIIKYEGDNNTIVWKHPEEDFNTSTQLIVHESQEAIFFLNGQALDSFGPGRHTLETENIPILRKLLNLVTGGECPFHAEIYFVNKIEKMNMFWGTDTKINFIDSTNNDYVFPIGAHGTLSFSVDNARKLLIKIVGTESQITADQLIEFMKSPIRAQTKNFLSEVLQASGVSVFELDKKLLEFSKEIRHLLNDEFENYGLCLEKFWIEAFEKPEDDHFYQKIIQLRGRKLTDVDEENLNRQLDLIRYQTEVDKTKMNIDAEYYSQQKLGYTYQQKQGFEVAKKMAENEGSGSDVRNNMMGMGMGLGLMSSTAGMANRVMGDVFNTVMMTPPDTKNVANEQAMDKNRDEIPGMLSLNEELTENKHVDIDEIDLKRKLKALRIAYEAGELTEEEYMEKKDKVLGI